MCVPSSPPGVSNRFTIVARNNADLTGGETMYNTVVWDDVSDLLNGPMINTNLGMGGFFTNMFTPPGGGPAVQAIVWNVGTFPPKAVFAESFGFRLLSAGMLPRTNYVNDAFIDSDQTTAIFDEEEVFLPPPEIPEASFAKGDDLDSSFQISALSNDDSAEFTTYGETYPYGLLVRNNTLVKLRELLFFDMIPQGVTFNSA